MSRKDPAENQSSRSREVSPCAGRKQLQLFAAGAVVLIIVAGIAALVFPAGKTKSNTTMDVTMPTLSATADRGAQAFGVSCAGCHGERAGGTSLGPPLVHRIYEPSHHGDAAIYRAARMGVQPHHWNFGPMPKIDISDQKLAAIVAYVRELQKANGIH